MELQLKQLRRRGAALDLEKDENKRVTRVKLIQPRRYADSAAPTAPNNPVPAAPNTPASAAPSSPTTAQQVITSKGMPGVVLETTMSYQLAGRAGTSVVKLATGYDHLLDKNKPVLLEVGAAPDAIAAGTAAFAVLGAGANVVSNAYKLHTAKEAKQDKIKEAAAKAEAAFKFVESGGKEGSGSAYLQFNKATQPILVKRNGMSANHIEKQTAGTNVGRYLASVVSSLSSFASYVGKAAGAVLAGTSQVSGAGGIVTGLAEVRTSLLQHEKASWDLESTKTRQEGLTQWREEVEKANAKSPLETGLHNAECKEQARREKLARRSKFNAKVGVVKGTANVAAGIALIVVSSIAAVATAGIWLSVAAGLVIGGLAAWGLRHVWRESKVARHAKRRQRQAQALMATHSQEALEAMISKTNANDRKCKVVTVERKHLLFRKKTARVRTLDVGQNGYLAMEIRSRRLAARLDPSALKWDDDTRQMILKVLENRPDTASTNKLGAESASALRLLKFVGMKDLEILALCHSALEEKDPAKRSALLRPHMADAHGLPWAKEMPLPAKAYFGPLFALAQQQPGAKVDYVALSDQFRKQIGEENFKNFQNAIAAEPRRDNEHEMVRFARAIADPAAVSKVAPRRAPPGDSGVTRLPKPFVASTAQAKRPRPAAKAKSGAGHYVALTSSKDGSESSNVGLNSSLPSLKSEAATSDTLNQQNLEQ